MVWFWLVLLLLVLLAAAVCFYFHVALVRFPAKMERPIETDPTWRGYAEEFAKARREVAAWPKEDVSLCSFDGLTLRGWYYPQPQARGTVILMHGYRGQGLRDFVCVLPFYRAQGFNILVPDERSHGRSDGRYITFGVKERLDCRDWVLWLERRDPACGPVLLHGVSMGAATVLMASGLMLPACVRGIIADCGYTSPRAIMTHVCRRNYHTPTFPIMPLCDFLAKLLAGFGFDDCSTLDCVARTDLPILFIHGTADGFVPAFMSQQNYDACPSEKELLLVEGATHAVSYLTDPKLCETTVVRFIEKHIAQKE